MAELVIVPTEFVHPDRYGAVRTSRKRLAVLHTTEGWEGVDRAEQLIAICKLPGDRISSSGSRYGSSYHYCADTDCVRQIVPENRVAYSAPGANSDGVHFVFPAKVAQTRSEWLAEISTGLAIWQCAMWLLDIEARLGIPAVRLTDAGVLSGASGVVDHWAITRCYRQTTHTDVGDTFPWDVLADRIASLRNPPRPPDKPVVHPSLEETMLKYRDKRYGNVFLINGGVTTTGGVLADAVAGPIIEDVHDQSLIAYMRSSHLKMGQMVPTGQAADRPFDPPADLQGD